MGTEKSYISEKEARFCELYVNGGVGFAGQPLKCYLTAYDIQLLPNTINGTTDYLLVSKRLLNRSDIKAKIKELAEENAFEDETIAVKLQVTESLKSIIAEASTDKYKDKYGLSVSPAPLRAVAVNASKALAEMYPIKHSQASGDPNASNHGVVFNVIVPSTTPTKVPE